MDQARIEHLVARKTGEVLSISEKNTISFRHLTLKIIFKILIMCQKGLSAREKKETHTSGHCHNAAQAEVLDRKW